MKQRKWRVSADVTARVRAMLFEQHPPRLERVFCQSLTWAYGVDSTFLFNADPVDCTLYAIHRTAEHEAFLAQLGGNSMRPDGTLLHLTLATAPGIPPAQAGRIDPAGCEWIEPFTFGTQLRLQPLFVQQPTYAPA